MDNYDFFMEKAIEQAKKGGDMGEVPIGCIITYGGNIIAEAFNTRNTFKNVLHHAEILAINEASKIINDWRLEDCSIFVTIEPCPMCAGAILQSRMKRLVFGAKNPKAGACGSVINILQNNMFNHQVEIISGILENECAFLMKNFFKEKR